MSAPGAAQRPWPTKRLKFCASYNDEVLPESTDNFEPIRYVEISDVSLVGGIENATPMHFHEAPSRARRRVRSGDILVSTVRTYLKAIAAVNQSPSNLIASTGFCVIRPRDGLDAGYAGWVVKSEEFVGEIVSRSVGVSYPAINASQLVNIEVPLPPIEVQERISAFLDKKTAQIDALIEKKRALLDRLAEKRQAIITQAVTKGLNPDASMKDSGIDWLGQIPAHWEVAAISHRYHVQLGRMLNAERSEGDNLKPYLRVYDVQWGWINVDDLPLMDFPLDAQRRYRLIPGDLLVNEGGSYVGRSAIWEGLLEECYYQKALHRLRPLDNRSDMAGFLLLLMETAVKQGVFVAGGNQTTIDHLTAEQIKRYRFGFPPFDEQAAIVEDCGKYLDHISAVSEKITNSFEKLQEYRSALITAAITGQIEGLR